LPPRPLGWPLADCFDRASVTRSEWELDSGRDHGGRPDAALVQRHEDVEEQRAIAGQLPLRPERAVDLGVSNQFLIAEGGAAEEGGGVRSDRADDIRGD